MSEKAKVIVLNPEKVELPAYATAGAAGMDLRAVLPEGTFLVLDPLERTLIPTGLFLEIPEGMEAQIRPRSGLALKQGITVLNSPGTIDSDYRGEIKVILVNLSNSQVVINNGERIAQMVFAKCVQVELVEVQTESLPRTERGEGGFGSTGKK